MFRRNLLLFASLTAVYAPHAAAQTSNALPSAYTFSTVVSSNTPVPDRPGTTFAIVNGSPAPAIDGNYVVFFESFYTAVLWSVNTTTGQFTRLADTTTAVPGGTSAFNSFNSYQVFNGAVVFSAAGSSDPRGLFSVPVTGGAITKLVDLNTPVPGGTGTLNFDSSGGPNYRVNDGGVLFGAYSGVYLVPATGGAVARDFRRHHAHGRRRLQSLVRGRERRTGGADLLRQQRLWTVLPLHRAHGRPHVRRQR